MSAGSTWIFEESLWPNSFWCLSTICCTIGSSGSISRTPVKLTPEYWYGSKFRVCRSCTHARARTHTHIYIHSYWHVSHQRLTVRQFGQNKTILRIQVLLVTHIPLKFESQCEISLISADKDYPIKCLMRLRLLLLWRNILRLMLTFYLQYFFGFSSKFLVRAIANFI